MSKILSVDDNPTITDFIDNILRDDHQVFTAANGKEALEAVRLNDPDLIIIDIMMPVMDGLEAVRILKADHITRHIPIIMLTALGKDEDIVNGLNAGADDYMEKPFSTKVFLARVKAHLRSKTLYDTLGLALEDLMDANNKLSELDKLKSNFIAIAAHELRTPLNIISGYIEMLVDGISGPINDEAMGLLKLSLQSCKDLSKATKDMLDISIIDSGKLPLELQTNDLNDLIKKMLKAFELPAKEKNISFEFSDNKKALTLVDSKKFNQILVNLTSNALNFTPSGGKISINISEEANKFIISVIDSGSGISSSSIDNIFDEFYKSPNSIGGTGLGLSICKRLVEIHNGTIWVESIVGKGSSFYFSIPKRLPANVNSDDLGTGI